MKIGLIIPYKNAERWLARCLGSIGAQPFEVILVDDQSEDDGPVIATEACMSSEDWHYFKTYDKTGAAHARNIGLKVALENGCDFVTFLDSDDELTPDAYEKMEQAIAQEPDEAIIQFNHYAIDANGWKFPRLQNNKGTYTLGNLPKLWVSCVNKIFRADLVRPLLFNEILRHGEDEIFVLECLKTARRIYHSERFTMIYHRDNPKSLSKSTTIYDLIDEQDALLQFITDNAPFYPEQEEQYELLEAVRKRQAELWNNAVYKRIFGGAK